MEEFPQDRHARELRQQQKRAELEKRKRPGVGVVIGRFQVPYLHYGHEYIIGEADKHDRLLVFIGIHPKPLTRSNPLDYPTRARMVLEKYPHAIVAPLPDVNDDKVWSRGLDRNIRQMVPFGEVTIYGGRESFIPHYDGIYKTKEIEIQTKESGTDLREDVAHKALSDVNFRRGIIYASQNQYARVSPAVDIAIIRAQALDLDGDTRNVLTHQVLLVQRPNIDKWRFPGGFVSESDNGYEHTARREMLEETNLTAEGSMDYIGSFRSTDWRNTPGDTIFTTLYCTEYTHGTVKLGDDLEGGKSAWVNISNLKNTSFADGHERLGKALFDWLENKLLIPREIKNAVK